jgi:hypothetical protein
MTVLRKRGSGASGTFTSQTGHAGGDFYVLCGYDDSDVFRRKYHAKRIALNLGLEFLAHIPVVTGAGFGDMMESGLTGLGAQPVHGIREIGAGEGLFLLGENPLKARAFWDFIMSLRFADMDQAGLGKA